MECGLGEVGRSERRPVMGRIRVSTSPGTKVSPRPTGASLRERVQIHLKRGRQIGDGGGSTTRLCTPSSGNPEPGDCKLVPQRLFRGGSRIDYRSVFEVLEPCAGNSQARFLEGLGGRKAPPSLLGGAALRRRTCFILDSGSQLLSMSFALGK